MKNQNLNNQEIALVAATIQETLLNSELHIRKAEVDSYSNEYFISGSVTAEFQSASLEIDTEIEFSICESEIQMNGHNPGFSISFYPSDYENFEELLEKVVELIEDVNTYCLNEVNGLNGDRNVIYM